MAEKYACAQCGKKPTGKFAQVDQHTGNVFCMPKVTDSMRQGEERPLSSMSCGHQYVMSGKGHIVPATVPVSRLAYFVELGRGFQRRRRR